MAYFIKESSYSDKNLIENFNNELNNHGYKFKLPLPTNEKNQNDDFIFENNYILVEDDKAVRAGYTLKNQWFKINKSVHQIAYYYNPVTAGLFNKKYNICGLLLLIDAQKKKYETMNKQSLVIFTYSTLGWEALAKGIRCLQVTTSQSIPGKKYFNIGKTFPIATLNFPNSHNSARSLRHCFSASKGKLKL